MCLALYRQLWYSRRRMTRVKTIIAASRLIDGNQYAYRTHRSASAEEVRCFKAKYGVSPQVALNSYRKLRLVQYRPKVMHLLWGLAFLKTAGTEHTLAKKLGTDRQTLRKYSREVVRKLGALKKYVVRTKLLVKLF